MTIFNKHLLSLAAALSLFSVVLSLLGSYFMTELIGTERHNVVRDSVRSSVDQNRFIFFAKNEEEINEWLRTIVQPDSTKYVAVLNADNEPVYLIDELGLAPSFDSDGLPSIVHSNLNESDFAHVFVDMNLSTDENIDGYSSVHLVVDSRRGEIYFDVAVGILTSLLISILIILPLMVYLSRLVSRPIVGLSEQLSNIDPSDIEDRRIQLEKSAPVELVPVADTLNNLFVAVEDHTNNMDQKVAQRTEWLSDAILMAQENEQEKQALIANLSHDLKTPLASIGGYLQLIREQMAENDYKTASANVGKAFQNTQRMLAEINDILHVSSAELVDRNEPTEFVIKTACESVLSKHQLMTSRANNRIETSYVGEKVANSNEFILSHVLDNVIGNANKYCTDALVSITITTGSSVDVVVSDNGPGMPPEALSMLFEPKQILNRDDISSGLGLFLCRRLIENIGGSIRAESKLGSGLTIFFSMPNMDK